VEYEIVVTREGIMDEITLRIECTPQLDTASAEQLAQRLKERHKIKTNLTCKAIIEPTGSLPRFALKAKRFHDKREVIK
jgi:phenylacetate-CoA ligase